MAAAEDVLVAAFHRAALFLIERIKRDGWRWSSNYLREHVRCTTNLRFSNSVSPDILRRLRSKHPELRDWITIEARKEK